MHVTELTNPLNKLLSTNTLAISPSDIDIYSLDVVDGNFSMHSASLEYSVNAFSMNIVLINVS